jgi:hypothetical protein
MDLDGGVGWRRFFMLSEWKRGEKAEEENGAENGGEKMRDDRNCGGACATALKEAVEGLFLKG